MSINWSKYAPELTRAELACNCCGQAHMDERFLDRLIALRRRLGFQFIINSGYRCPDHNERVALEQASPNPKRDGPHTTGRAVDIKLNGERVFELMQFAPAFGMTGFGLKQHGSYARRYVHLDDLENELRPRIWTYQ